MTGAAFAKLHGIRYTTFAYWRQRRSCRSGAEKETAQAELFFEEVELRAARSEAAGLSVTLPGGASVKIESLQTEVLRGTLTNKCTGKSV